jgi:serine/threonine protein kinase
MGVVFRAQDCLLQREVAIKILTTAVNDVGQQLSRFSREARLQAMVRHPNIVQIYDASLQSDPPFLVMELVHGESLITHLKDHGPLLGLAWERLASELIEAVQELHQHEVLHRDIKPANIMIRRESGATVLMDLGLAQITDETLFTQTGTLLGTPLYLAPETVAGQAYTQYSDQYQLALVLFEAILNKPPFLSCNLGTLLRDICNGKHRSWPHPLPVPTNIVEALEQAMHPNPKERFPDLEALANALRGQQTTPGNPALPPSPSAHLPPQNNPSTRSKSLLPLFLFLLFTFVTSAIIWGRKTNSPNKIRYRLAGNQLAVEYDPHGAQGIHLLLGEERIFPAGKVNNQASFQKIVVSHLIPGKAYRVCLAWKGGKDATSSIRGQKPAIHPHPHLMEQGLLRVEVRRPVKWRWDTTTTNYVPINTGLQTIPHPPITSPLKKVTWTLSWLEQGLPFQHTWSLNELLLAERNDFLEVSEGLKPNQKQRSRFRNGRTVSPEDSEIRNMRQSLLRLRPWIGWMLRLPLPTSAHWLLFKRWQLWERTAHLEYLLQGKTKSLRLPSGSPGSRFAHQGRKASKQLSAPLVARAPPGRKPTKQGWILLSTTLGKTLLLFASERQETFKSVEFLWPQLPVGNSNQLIKISLQVRSLNIGFELRLGPQMEKDDWGTISLWADHPTIRPAKIFHGELGILLPRKMLPPAGTPFAIRLHNQVTLNPTRVQIGGLRIAPAP